MYTHNLYRKNTRRKFRTLVWLAIKVIVLIVIGFAVLSVIGGWLFMLCIGAAHSHDARIPALGFGASYFLALALGSLGGAGAFASSSQR